MKVLKSEDKQELFDMAYKAIIKQRRPSTSEHGGCLYQNSQGLRCAASHCLTDKARELAAIFETTGGNIGGTGFGSLCIDIQNKNPLAEIPSEELIDFMSNLQIIHDTNSHDFSEKKISSSTYLKMYKDNMKHYAEEKGLVIPEI